jgi:hypothetical protein
MLMKGAQALIQKISNKENLPKISDIIAFPDFTNAIRKWRESTSTSPSGRHLGCYKSLLVNDKQSSKYNELYKDPKDRILKLYYHIAVAAFRAGISLQRWQTSITTMIEKIPGSPRINKLRVIHIYEADYNLMLKIIWARRLVWQVS